MCYVGARVCFFTHQRSVSAEGDLDSGGTLVMRVNLMAFSGIWCPAERVTVRLVLGSDTLNCTEIWEVVAWIRRRRMQPPSPPVAWLVGPVWSQRCRGGTARVGLGGAGAGLGCAGAGLEQGWEVLEGPSTLLHIQPTVVGALPCSQS